MTECCGDDPEPDRANPAGQPELRYRVGTWSSFRRRMLLGLARQPHSPDADPAEAERPLARLTTRADDDASIALVDACACVCDVLTFYGERILNEGYLGTATETRSVTEIARSIGYRPSPGLAATTTLAFTVDPQVEGEVVVPRGQPVLSVPGPGEVPQTFEAGEEVPARREWNLMRPRRTVAHPISAGTDTLYLDGITTGLRVGDPVVVLGAERAATPGADTTERWDLRHVTAVETFTAPDTYAATNHTRITLDHGLGDGHTGPAAAEHRVVTFGARASLFGWNAPDARMMSAEIKGNSALVKNGQWRDFSLADDSTRRGLGSAVLDLDREYPGMVADSWVCLVGPTEVELYRVLRANPASRTEFSLTARTTRLFLDSSEHLDSFKRRSVAVLGESRELPIARRPDDSQVSGFTVELDDEYAPVPVGRRVVVVGEDTAGERVVVETAVASWAVADGRAVLGLATELPALRRDTLQVHGNVAPASHGTTVAGEVLGHGDAARLDQRFELRRPPLTWLATPSAAANTLSVRVAGVAWEEVPTLFGAGPNDRVYTVGRVIDDDPSDGGEPGPARTVVAFGDGRRGARLPSGVDNVTVDYRTGVGMAGNVAAHSLTLLQQRPAAIRAVDNPRAAHGGADPAPASEIRRLAPLDVLTLGRLVSVQDYEDHAASFPGVGKARAASLWDGHRSFVHLTVAEGSGVPLPDSDSDLRTALLDSLAGVKDPAHRLVVQGHLVATYAISLRLRVEPGRAYSVVRDELSAALALAGGFEARRFGQPVTSAEVVATAHAVAGVQAVDLDLLHRHDEAPTLHEVLPAASATWDGGVVARAELLLADPAAIGISPLEDT